MTIIQPSRKFTDLDFDAALSTLKQLVATAFPDWTDFNYASFGNILLETQAHSIDVITHVLNQHYKEGWHDKARLRRSHIELGKWMGFALDGATAASVDLLFAIQDGNPRVGDILIPKGTVIRTRDIDAVIEFELQADVVIAANDTEETGTAKNTTLRSDSVAATGSPSQAIVLSSFPFLEGSSTVLAGVTTYTEVDDFFSTGPTDDHYVVAVNADGVATLTFGNGIVGSIPSGLIVVTYETGGGESGNVDANTLIVFRDGARFVSTKGEDVRLTVRNPSGAGGGNNAMTVPEARVAAQAFARTIGKRTVSQQDFEDNARKVRGVARAMFLGPDDDPSIPNNTGRLYIVPTGGGLPSSDLKDEVEDFINDEKPTMVGFTFSAEDPTLLIISIEATVYLASGVTAAEAQQAIEDALDTFFSLTNDDGSENTQIDFGYKIRKNTMPDDAVSGEISASDLFNVVRDAVNDSGVRMLRRVDLADFSPAEVIVLTDVQFPVLGSITLTNGDTGLPL